MTARIAQDAAPVQPAASWEPLAGLTPFAGNPRRNDATIPVVADSMIRFGFGTPMVARLENHMILAGHARYGAALLLAKQWEKATSRERATWHPDAVRVATQGEVVCRFVDLDEHDAKLYIVADNRIGEEHSTTDDDKLAQLLSELRAEDAELDLLCGTGLTDEAIRALLDDGAGGHDGQDPGPGEPPEIPVSQLGEIYELGPHRLMCGSSIDAADVRLLMNGGRAALMATDPPYLVDYTGEDHPQSAKRKAAFVAAGKPAEQAGNKNWDKYKDPTASVDFFSAFIRVALAEALVDNPAIYQWHASRRQALVEAAWVANGLLLHQQIVWAKSRPILTHSHFMWQHEPCFYGWIEGKPPTYRPAVCGENSTIWNIDQKGEQDGIHPTQKPLEIFERPIGYHTTAGDLVYEPFCGSGSQLIAAAKLGRRCFAMELEPGFVDVIRRRWTGYARSAGIDPGSGALDAA